IAPVVAFARQRLGQDSAWLTIVHRLRDPGVRLSMAGVVDEVPGAPALCQPSCAGLEVSFDRDAGDGTWIVEVNTATHRPELLEIVTPSGRSAFVIERWTTAGGLAWPARLVHVAAPGNVIDIDGVAVGAPREAAYEIPVVRDPRSSLSNLTNEGYHTEETVKQ